MVFWGPIYPHTEGNGIYITIQWSADIICLETYFSTLHLPQCYHFSSVSFGWLDTVQDAKDLCKILRYYLPTCGRVFHRFNGEPEPCAFSASLYSLYHVPGREFDLGGGWDPRILDLVLCCDGWRLSQYALGRRGFCSPKIGWTKPSIQTLPITIVKSVHTIVNSLLIVFTPLPIVFIPLLINRSQNLESWPPNSQKWNRLGALWGVGGEGGSHRAQPISLWHKYGVRNCPWETVTWDWRIWYGPKRDQNQTKHLTITFNHHYNVFLVIWLPFRGDFQ